MGGEECRHDGDCRAAAAACSGRAGHLTGEEVVMASEAPVGGGEGAGATILLVEDDPGVRLLARRALELAGHRVLEAESPSRALVMVENEQRVDLLVTDVILPGMTGRALAERLRSERQDLRVVFTSGYAVAQEVLERGTSFLWKPYTPQQLAEMVREALAS
jgi:CheY-like chemotaxis protein